MGLILSVELSVCDIVSLLYFFNFFESLMIQNRTEK